MSGKRIYIGKMPRDTMKADVEKFFEGYGRIQDCRIMNGFGFVEFESAKDADDVVANFSGKKLLGEPVIVEHAKESRRERGFEERPRTFQRRPGFRIIVHGVSRDVSWQDLKDFGREAGAVTFSDIDRDNPGDGILEYLNAEDADNALRVLNNRDLRGTTVSITRGEAPVGGGGADHGGRDRDFRRERSRSPPGRREPYERRRSPPKRDDDRRPAYDERDRRDSRREDRYAEPPRASGGEDRYADRAPRYDDRARYEDRGGRENGRRNGDADPAAAAVPAPGPPRRSAYEDRGGGRYDDRRAAAYPEDDRSRRDDRDRRERDGVWR